MSKKPTLQPFIDALITLEKQGVVRYDLAAEHDKILICIKFNKVSQEIDEILDELSRFG